MPQTTDAYEIGLKSELFGRKLRANLSAFWNDVEDIQVRGLPPTSPTPIFYNATSGRFRGVDVELVAAPVRNLDIQANLSYLDARYGDGFTNALFFEPRPFPPGGLRQFIGDASGRRPVFSPKWAGSISAQYTLPTDIGAFRLAGAYTYSDEFFFDPQNRVRQPSFGLVNASLAWEVQEGLELRTFVNNLTDKRYVTNVAPSTSGDYYYPGAPRTYGMSLWVAVGR